MTSQMETFSALLALCARNSLVTVDSPSQRPVTRSFGVFCDLRLNKRLSKHSKRRWFETPSRSLWRHWNGFTACITKPHVHVAWTGKAEIILSGFRSHDTDDPTLNEYHCHVLRSPGLGCYAGKGRSINQWYLPQSRSLCLGIFVASSFRGWRQYFSSYGIICVGN